MKKTLITLGIFASFGALAQSNVGIGTLNPNPQAILDIQSNDKGILISRLTTVSRNTLGTSLTAAEDGMLVYDKDLKAFFYWDGAALAWVQVGSGTGDNWGTQVVQTSGSNISGDGTSANPLTVTDGDSDPNNEIELPASATTGQVLTWDGTDWIAQNASSGADNWGNQVVQTSGSNISGDGTSANPLTVTDGDTDATNEIELPTGGTNGQVLSTDGSGNYTWVNDNAGTDDQNIANLAFDNTTNILTVGIENGTSQTIDLSALLNDADSDPNNEIQDLALNGNILTITNNSSPTNIDLSSYLDNTDAQNLTSSVTGGNATVNISGGTGTTFSINDADSDPTNEIELPTGGTNGQVLSTNGSGTYSWITDNAGTDDQNISGSGLSGTTLTIGIENGNNETVNLSSLIDHDWYKVGTTSPPTSINNNIFTQGKVGIGTNSPSELLELNNGGIQINQAFGIGFSGATPSNGNVSSDQARMYYDYNLFGTNQDGLVFEKTDGNNNNPDGGFAFTMKGQDNVRDVAMVIRGSGNVGINTTSPSEKLQVNGSVKIVDGTQGAGKVLTSDANGKANWEYRGTPPGVVESYAGIGAVPPGFLDCDGSAVSRTTYADLFAVIGTRYGTGNGTTTFNLPDYRGYFLRGYDNGAGNDPDVSSRTSSGNGTTGDNIGTKQSWKGGIPLVNWFAYGYNSTGTGTQNNIPGGLMATDDYVSGGGGLPYVQNADSESRPINISVRYIIKY